MSDASPGETADVPAGDAGSEESAAAERYESSPLPSHPVFYVLLLVGAALIWVGAGPASGEPTGLYGLWGASLIVGTVASYVAYLLWHAVG